VVAWLGFAKAALSPKTKAGVTVTCTIYSESSRKRCPDCKTACNFTNLTVGFQSDTRRQRAVGSRAAFRSGLCFFWGEALRVRVYVDGFNLHYGALKGTPFKKRDRTIPDALIAEVYTMEEKGSDVNLAAHLLNDAWKGLFDMAAVISNDTDLITPIRMVTDERKKPVLVVCPGRWQMAPKLKDAATYGRHIHPAMLKAAQFPGRIPRTTISKPKDW
jgi:uncharacterized LabA/DUF88 family protein